MDLDGRVQWRGAFVFNYREEIVPIAELDTIAQDAQAAAKELGVHLYIDWKDFHVNHGSAGNQPLCSEPWKSL